MTGATGLLGNNLVRALLAEGFQVRGLARSEAKARQQFERLPIEIVSGDLHSIPSFSAALSGVDVLFHTAAYFRTPTQAATTPMNWRPSTSKP
ncbi:dihydroflavonol-4-reductase [Gluconobacter frateurii M-2]|nr:dihydroflavonol-4-reductase [Gluconobacter frateurii M-2]